MGRYFKAQPVELNRDFIYQPPLELMAKALLKKDDDIQQQADTMELIRSLPIDFIDYHKEGAANIKNEINSDIDNFAKEIQSKAALDGSLKAKLNAYKNKLQERYSTGDIYNIQETAKNYREFEKKLEDDKTLSSAQKEKHKQSYWEDYTKQNPEGQYKTVYTPGPIIQDADYLTEYSTWFKKLEQDKKKDIVEKAGGKWNTLTETERNGIVLENGHQTFLEARPDLKELVTQQGKSKVYADRDIQFNKDGNLNYQQGFLGSLGKAAKEMNYTDTTDSTKLEENPYYKWEIERADAKAKEAEDKRIAAMMEVNTNAANQYKVSVGAINAEQNMVNDINSRFAKKGLKYKINRLEDVLNIPNAQKAFPKMYQKVKEKIADTQSKMNANWQYAYNFTDAKGIQQMKTEFEKKVVANQRDIKYNIPNTTFKKYDPKTKSYITMDVTTMKNDGIGIKELIGAKMLAPNGKWVIIDGASYVPNSATPVFLNTPETGENNLNRNDAITSLEFQYLDGETTRTFTRPANFYMDSNVGVMTK